MEVLEVLDKVFSIAEVIYNLVEQASSNKTQCGRLKKRIEMLVLSVELLKSQPGKSKPLKKVGTELNLSLENAHSWVKKYSNQGWWKQLIKANKIREEFDLINDRLTDHAEALSLLMTVQNRGEFLKFFNEKKWKKQNQEALQKDFEDLKESLTSEMTPVANKVDQMNKDVQDLISQVKALSFSWLRTPWDPTEIRSTDLNRGDLMMERPGHYLYRGEYHKAPVVIKVLKGQLIKNDALVRKTFQSEIRTMKRYECMNILRLYGICIDNSGSDPCYSMVMELCEKGTLRELLSNEPNLLWDQRIRMTLDGARALYRLHQTEEKAILHGNLSSLKFLVDGRYYLKLCGFELAKTESSMRKTSNAQRREQSTELTYIAPETMKDINAYDKSSEIYSLGVVFWEIASGKAPLKELLQSDMNSDDLYEKQCSAMEALIPPDCPDVLRNIIRMSQAEDPSARPSAGVIVDLLMAHLNLIQTCPPEAAP
ncbi:mixed lineage kinase domain-like protein isoform 2-T2 [Discoglossus pictus]